jgi:hypothetical protein
VAEVFPSVELKSPEGESHLVTFYVEPDGSVRARVYGHHPEDGKMCFLCAKQDACDKAVVKDCFVPCG